MPPLQNALGSRALPPADLYWPLLSYLTRCSVRMLELGARGLPNIKHGSSYISGTERRLEVEFCAVAEERWACITKLAIDDRPEVDGG